MDQDSQDLIYYDFDSDGSIHEVPARRGRKSSSSKTSSKTKPKAKSTKAHAKKSKPTIEWSSEDED